MITDHSRYSNQFADSDVPHSKRLDKASYDRFIAREKPMRSRSGMVGTLVGNKDTVIRPELDSSSPGPRYVDEVPESVSLFHMFLPKVQFVYLP
jgi:hypothetical protein